MSQYFEWFKSLGSLAGLSAFFWNLYSAYYNRRGYLEVTLGWKTIKNDLSTVLIIKVVNKGIYTRVVDFVSIVYLDEEPKKNVRNSTSDYITILPSMALKRGDRGIEEIFYQEDKFLEDILLHRPLMFRVVDTFGKSYNSTRLNDGKFSLPRKVV